MHALLVINARVNPDLERDIELGVSPRKDYIELRQALGADILDLSEVDRSAWAGLLRRLAGAGVAQSVLAWIRSSRYDAIFADRETTGFILAGLLQLKRRRPRLVMIGHLLSSPKKRHMARLLKVQKAVDCLIVHSSLQEKIAQESLGLGPEQIELVPYHADDRFWRPSDRSPLNQICSVGLEYRDYPTLMAATEGLDVEVIIAAASHWSHHQGVDARSVPANVRVGSFRYDALRRLYAESRFVVVPLIDVDNQAGITVILEAMAMGKAVIVSHSRGQTDVIRDRRQRNRNAPDREAQPSWLRDLGVPPRIADLPTGLYVVPHDAEELRKAVVYLLDHPEVADGLGRNGRAVIEAGMSLDAFSRRVAVLIRGRSIADETEAADRLETASV